MLIIHTIFLIILIFNHSYKSPLLQHVNLTQHILLYYNYTQFELFLIIFIDLAIIYT